MWDTIVAELGLAEHLGAQGASETNARQWGSLPETLSLELISNQHFNAAVDEGAALAHFEDLWHRLPKQRDADVAAAHAAAFEEATGTTFDDLQIIGFAMWAHAHSQNVGLYPADYIDKMRPTERERKALDLLVADVDTVRDLVKEEVARCGFDWSANTFRRFPVIRHPDGCLTLTNPDFLLGALHRVRRVLGAEQPLQLTGKEGLGRIQEVPVGRHRGLRPRGSDVHVHGGSKRVWREKDLQGVWPDV